VRAQISAEATQITARGETIARAVRICVSTHVFQNVTPMKIVLIFGTRWERIAPESLLATGQRFVHG